MQIAYEKAKEHIKNENKKKVYNGYLKYGNSKRCNSLGYERMHNEYRKFCHLKQDLIKLFNTDIVNMMSKYIHRETIYVPYYEDDLKINKKITYKVLWAGTSFINDWCIEDESLYLYRKVKHKTLNLNKMEYDITFENEKIYEVNFYNEKKQIVYKLKFDKSQFRLSEKEKQVLTNPSKYNSNYICDKYLVNVFHKNVLKYIKIRHVLF